MPSCPLTEMLAPPSISSRIYWKRTLLSDIFVMNSGINIIYIEFFLMAEILYMSLYFHYIVFYYLCCQYICEHC